MRRVVRLKLLQAKSLYRCKTALQDDAVRPVSHHRPGMLKGSRKENHKMVKKRLQVTIPADLLQAAHEKKSRSNESIAFVVQKALEMWIAGQEFWRCNKCGYTGPEISVACPHCQE